jgi:hypothetical protein
MEYDLAAGLDIVDACLNLYQPLDRFQTPGNFMVVPSHC